MLHIYKLTFLLDILNLAYLHAKEQEIKGFDKLILLHWKFLVWSTKESTLALLETCSQSYYHLMQGNATKENRTWIILELECNW